MSGLYGTTQAYNPVAGNYLALAPNCGDKIFGTNIDYCDLVKWGIFDGQENDPRVLSAYTNQYNAQKLSLLDEVHQARQTYAPTSYTNAKSSAIRNVMDVIDQLPHLSTFRSLIYQSGWNEYLEATNELRKVTIFAPVNSAWNRDGWETISLKDWKKYNLRNLMKGHTLPFGFEQDFALGRKTRLYTVLPSFSVYIDGTGQVQKNLNFYIPPDEMLTMRYPKPMRRINVLNTYYTNNGAVYEIDGVFNPNVIVY